MTAHIRLFLILNMAGWYDAAGTGKATIS